MVAEVAVKNKIEEAKSSGLGRFFVYITFILIFPIFLYISTRNTFRRQQQGIEETASDIDVQLKKRFDELTKMINSVKGVMKFEKSTQTAITAMRSGLGTKSTIKPEDFAKNNSLMDQALRGINVQLENYPDLKSSNNVMALQQSIADIEANIAAARRFYNTAVRAFNNRILTYPTNVAGQAMHLSTMVFFEATAEEKQDVKVDLSV